MKILTKSKTKTLILLSFSFLGFLDATYLTAKHLVGGTANCILGSGCEQVLTSRWSEISGIPISLFGAIYYLTIFVLAILFFRTKKIELMIPVLAVTSLGLIISAWLVYLQIFVIGQICTYCLASAIITTVLFITSLCLYIQREKTPTVSTPVR